MKMARASYEVMPGAAPDVMRDYDLSTLGYEETEYAVAGSAVSYDLVGERGEDGRWDVAPGAAAPFRTRMVVRRPIDPAAFSGTVVVEWHNVSAGIDAGPDWAFLHRHLAKAGHGWVGVSAQKAGIDGGGISEGIHLKVLAPDRYATLEHPGDAWSFDIFAQVGELLRLPADENPLRGLMARHLVAAGESQSAACLVTYLNAIDRHTPVFDGAFVHGRPGIGVAIDGVFTRRTGEGLSEATRAIASRGERIRDDVRIPVVILQSETDLVVLGGRLAAQPDSDRLRVWEIAGAAHADTYTVSAGRVDDGTAAPERLAELLRPTRSLMIATTSLPVNAGPQQHYVAQAALAHLVGWITEGTPPPVAPRLELSDSGEGYRLDDMGNARGGIRTPWVEAPTAVLSGLGQTGETFAILFGVTEPFDDDTLARLYPGGKDEYLARFEASLHAAIAAGFLLAEDRDEIAAIGACSYPLLMAEA
jgi:Alpha/beta hydrolase domain